MASRVYEHDHVFLANKPAWWSAQQPGHSHVFVGTPTIQDVMDAVFQWTVEKVQAGVYNTQTGKFIPIPGQFGLVRSDMEIPFPTTVGRIFGPTQPMDALRGLMEVAEGQGAVIETAGTLWNGQKIWALARDPRPGKINGDDLVRYFLFWDSYVDHHTAQVMWTDVRVVCQNTMTRAIRSGDGKSKLSISHKGNMSEKVPAAVKAWAIQEGYREVWVQEAESLVALKLGGHEVKEIVEASSELLHPGIAGVKIPNGDILGAVLEKTGKLAKLRAKRNKTSMGLYTYLEHELKTAGEQITNGWLLANAVGAFVDTHQKFKGTDEEQGFKRFESIIDGRAKDIKDQVWEMLLAKVPETVQVSAPAMAS